MTKTTITFGEIMLRLAPPGFERFLQSPSFGATFGGPVWIPKVFNGRDKLFFFAAYQHLKTVYA